jgi:hypothetical protein
MMRRIKRPTWVFAAIVVAATTHGCVVSPQPLPPITPVIDVTRLQVTPMVGFIQIHGLPGAVTDGATLSALAATTSGQTAATVVATDGSFDVSLANDPANIYRLEAELEGEFSAPVDVAVADTAFDAQTAAPAPVTAPFAGCLVVSPVPVADEGALRIGKSLAFAVQLQNGCAEDIVADDVRLRAGNAGFVLDTAAPLTIGAGTVRSVSLRFEPKATGPTEDLLVVHVTGSEAGYLLVTTRGEGIP